MDWRRHRSSAIQNDVRSANQDATVRQRKGALEAVPRNDRIRRDERHPDVVKVSSEGLEKQYPHLCVAERRFSQYFEKH